MTPGRVLQFNFRRIACVAVLAGMVTVQGAEPPELFPFVLPWDDATPGITDLSGWREKPAGKNGPVMVGKDGHLYAGRQRIRFFGVNTCFGASFPTHEAAEKIAARMAKFGINVVRFHHMDMEPFPNGIRARGRPDTRELDPEALDRLDYFIGQLKAHGIYANLNLLVSRRFTAADGLPAAIDQLDWKEKHTVGFFDPAQLALQKEYARKLLTHRNPYTKQTYADEPAVAFVEVNNENGLLQQWLDGGVDALPAVFQQELKRQWNKWLWRRYESTEALTPAWRVAAEPVGEEMLSIAPERWVLEQHAGAEASRTATIESTQVAVKKLGTTGWHVQYHQPGLKLMANRPYSVSFRAKADRAAVINVNVGEAHAPWGGLGLSVAVRLTSEWQSFRFTFTASASDDNARLCFSDLAKQTGEYWIADVSLRPGGVVGLQEGETLEANTVPFFAKSQFGERPPAAQRDWLEFLWETEDRYWQTMRRYLKDELKVRAVLMGTIVGCSTPNLMAGFDAVDTHAYWQHPHFPGKAWDPVNWTVANRSMVNEPGGTLPDLAWGRVFGKPHSVTEYNHAAPNTFSSEAYPLLAAFAGFQDWDAIYAFAYSHRRDDWDTRHITSFFDIDQHPTKLATLVPAVAMFVRGDIAAAVLGEKAHLTRDGEIELLHGAHAWGLGFSGRLGIPAVTALTRRVGLVVGNDTHPLPLQGGESDKKQFAWDQTNPNRGVVIVNSPKSKAVIGYGAGRRFELGDWVVEPGETRQDGWSVITVTEIKPGDFLITATGYAENTEMGWKNAEKNSVGRDWGRAPSLVEGVPAKLHFREGKSSAWALDERGQRREIVPVVTDADGGAVVVIDSRYRTLWYEVSIAPTK